MVSPDALATLRSLREDLMTKVRAIDVVIGIDAAAPTPPGKEVVRPALLKADGANGTPSPARASKPTFRFSKNATPAAPQPTATPAPPNGKSGGGRPPGEARVLAIEVLKNGPEIGLTFAELLSRVKAKPHRTKSAELEEALNRALHSMKGSGLAMRNGVNWVLTPKGAKS